MSVSVKCKSKFDAGKVKKAVKRANPTSLKGVGALVRRIAANSVKKSKNSSRPGTPPNTRGGRLKKGILFYVDRNFGSVIIGPSADLVGTSMVAHEFGGRYKKQTYPRRPLMGPALEKVKDKLPQQWRGVVK